MGTLNFQKLRYLTNTDLNQFNVPIFTKIQITQRAAFAAKSIKAMMRRHRAAL